MAERRPVSAATGLVALLGSPVAHSLSPPIHEAAFAAHGLDLTYLAFDVASGDVPAAVHGLGALGALGANVTVPHKRRALELADEATDEARLVGAANTLWWRRTSAGRVLVADNTDAPGLAVVLTKPVALRPGDEVILFGAGGAALAAGVALGRAGATVEVVARRRDAAAEVERRLVAAGGRAAAVARPRLVVNATPLGLHGEQLPERLLALGPGQVALDLLYGRAPTPFLQEAARRGAQAHDGLGLLVAQAALSFERWTGLTAPVDAMRAAALAAIGSASTI